MKKVIFITIFLMILGSGTYVFFHSDYFHIETIEIFGEDKLSEFEILKYAGVKRKMNLLLLDTNEVKKNLEKHPMIYSATIDKIYPNRLSISYNLREPIFSIYYSNCFISIDKELYALSVDQNEKGLMTVYGLDIENFNLGQKIKAYDESLVEALVLLVKLVKISDLNFIPSIHVENGDIFLIIYKDFIINFGNGDNIENRFNAFYNIYIDLNESDVSQGIIDVSTDGLPIYKPFD
ncbi:MAG: FtsQ-type POTRA domain-containing protein [Bacillota bacterium]|nr:FtsQ-type POTRA domain-containing protein [Bacillota bacterium]